MTGFRQSYSGAQEYFGITPDLTTLGKMIGGGLPVGAYGARRDIMEMVAPARPMYQAGNLSGNPLAMTAGIHTLKRLRKPGSYRYLDKITKQLIEGILDATEGPFTASTMQREVTLPSLLGFIEKCWRKVYTLLPKYQHWKLGLQVWHIL